MERNKLEERLLSLARGDKLSHAYIIEGKKEGGKLALAESFAKAVTPYHEDITLIKAEGLSIKDKTVESIQERLSKKPLAGERNVALIQDADTMTPRAQNRLLKTLEEPPGGAVIMLLSENTENLLPTIVSRCVIFRMDESDSSDPGISKEARLHADTIGSMILEGRGFYAISRELNAVTADREQAYAFLDALEKWLRDRILISYGIADTQIDDDIRRQSELLKKEKAYLSVKLIEQARCDLNRNINTGYAIKSMILEMM